VHNPFFPKDELGRRRVSWPRIAEATACGSLLELFFEMSEETLRSRNRKAKASAARHP